MDVQAERRFQQLKKRLDALHYCQPLTMESAALAEKLLNDLLKTTEGFQKLKKINDELKSQTSNDALYLEPLKKENERVVKENNDLHMQMIRVKEECEQSVNTMRAQLRQIQNEKTDLQFLSSQKDLKIQDMDKTLANMRSKLDQALTKSYNPQANDIVKGLRKEINQQENVIGKKSEFLLSRPIDSQNIDPNRNQLVDFQTQQQVWADELRNADQRALLYKKDLDQLQQKLQDSDRHIKDLMNHIAHRDQEIQRLSLLYKGGQNFDTVKFNFDKSTAEDTIQKLHKQNEFINSENFKLLTEMNEIKELLGICESRDPTDVDRAHLKKLIRELKQRNDQMNKDIKNMEQVIQQLKSGQFNQSESLKMITAEEVQSLKRQLEDSEQQVQDLINQNQKLKSETDKVQQYQSAYMSNQKAFAEGMESLSKEVREKEAKLAELTSQNNHLLQETTYLKEELNMYKGKCTTLTRDVELSQSYLSKINTDNVTSNEQFNYLKDRVRVLELDLEQAIRAKTDANYEVKRLQNNIEQLEKAIHESKLQSMKAQGDSQNSSATVQRLQAQLNGKLSDVEILMRQKEELEKMVKQGKADILECEKKAADYYQQLLRTNENFNILQNEQKLLTQELTLKQSEVTKCEKEKLQLERELLQLRPLKSQLENYSMSTQKTIEENVRNEYEKNKLQSRVIELQNELDIKKNDLSDVNAKLNHQIVQNTKLIEQLKIFEKESFDIQNKIRRGFEVEKENESIARTIETLRHQEKDLLRQVEDLKSQISQRDTEIERLRSRTDNSSYYTKTLEKELSEQRAEIQRLNDIINQSQNDVVKTEQRKNQSEVEIVDLKRGTQLLRDEKSRLEADLVQIKKEYEDEKGRSKGLQQQVDRLRAMVENLDSTREQLVQRLQSTNKEKTSEEQDKVILLQDIQSYKQQLQQRDQEIVDLRKSIESLDSNIDELQAELDNKTQDLAQARVQLDKHIREISNLQHQMSLTTGSSDQQSKRLQDRESEIKQLRIELQGLRQQLEEQTQIAQIKTQETTELYEDIQTLTRENQYVSSEFSKSAQANEYLKKQSEELAERERHAQQALRALEIEKADILTTYRNACLENERLQDSIQMISQDGKEHYIKIQNLEKDIFGYQHRMRDVEARERNYIDEIHTLEGHIDKLTYQLEMVHQQLKMANEEKEALLNDMHQQRNLSYTLEAGKEDMNRTLSHIEKERYDLKQQVTQQQREVDILRRQLDIEREKYNELEQIQINDRKQLQQHQYKVHDLQVEVEQLKAEIQRLVLRSQSLQSHIDLLQKHSRSGSGLDSAANMPGGQDIARMQELEGEMENLRKENIALQNYVNKYEEKIQELESEVYTLSRSQQ